MPQIAWVLFTILSVISALHLYWAFGGIWPGRDEKSLAQTVIGANNITRMPPVWLTALVAILIFCAGLIPLMWSAVVPYSIPQGMVWIAMWVLAFIFLGRGIAGYLPFFRNPNNQQPFADLDMKYFSPLCIAIGTGYLGLIYLARI